jgi:altronate dehydratase
MTGVSQRSWMVLHPASDNVAIALREFEVGETMADVTVSEPIRRYHKMALTDIAEDQPVYKYGQIIGYTSKPVSAGAWVHTHNIGMGRLMETNITDLANDVPEPEPAIEDRYFLGYRNVDGRAGTRNYLLIGSTVDCSARVVDMVLEELNRKKSDYTRRYPNVDGIIGLRTIVVVDWLP